MQSCSLLAVLVVMLASAVQPEPDTARETAFSDAPAAFWDSRLDPNGEGAVRSMQALQESKLRPGKISGKRVLLCKTFGGMGNRIQGVTSCLAFALATNRALVLDWHLEYEDINGLMPCKIQDLFELPPGLNVNISMLHAEHSSEEVQTHTMEVFRSEVKMGSGSTPNWAELLLCRNLTHALEPVPVLLLPSFRWMPEIITNEHYRNKLRDILGTDEAEFYRRVAPAFFQPASSILSAIRELGRYFSQHGRRVGLHVRMGQATDDERQIRHFFSPASAWQAWEWPRTVVWFVATDAHHIKGQILAQLQRAEGKVVRGLHLEAVSDSGLGEYERLPRIDALDEWWPQLHPVVADFASGSRLVMLAQSTSRDTCSNLQGALVEMEMLARTHLLIASHLSTFTTFSAASLSPGALYHVTRDGDCFPASTLDPLSDAGDLYGDSSRPSCYVEKRHFEFSWARPRHLSERADSVP